MNSVRPHSVVMRIAALLREDAFRQEHDTLLGSEDDLVARFGVSRPTFRQAAKLVEQERLLKIKRGVGGGYFVQRPTSEAVAHVTAVYLHSRRATLKHLIDASNPLFAATAKAAAAGSDAAQLALLKAFVDRERGQLDEPMSLQQYLRSEREFGSIFYRLSANPVLNVFLEIVFDLSAFQHESVWAHRPERIQQSRRLRLRLAEAILEQDQESAEVAARRFNAAVSEWFEVDHTDAMGPLGTLEINSQREARTAAGAKN